MKAAYIFIFDIDSKNSYRKGVSHNSRFSVVTHVLLAGMVDHEDHAIQLVILAIQSSLY